MRTPAMIAKISEVVRAVSRQAFQKSSPFMRGSASRKAPAAPTLEGAIVAENAEGVVIGTLSATDPEGDAVTFSTTDTRFVIDGATLRLAEGVSLDHEAGATVQVAVTATDAEGNATNEREEARESKL